LHQKRDDRSTNFSSRQGSTVQRKVYASPSLSSEKDGSIVLKSSNFPNDLIGSILQIDGNTLRWKKREPTFES
jgi:hypothetical protein